MLYATERRGVPTKALFYGEIGFEVNHSDFNDTIRCSTSGGDCKGSVSIPNRGHYVAFARLHLSCT